MVNILYALDDANHRRTMDVLTNDGFRVIDMEEGISVERMIEQFEETDADVLFFEPGWVDREHVDMMMRVYSAMNGRPIVICSASDHDWYCVCQKHDMADIVVTGHCGMITKESFKDDVETALGAKDFEYQHYLWQLASVHTNLMSEQLFHMHMANGATAVNVANGIGDPDRWAVENYQLMETEADFEGINAAMAFVRDFLASKQNRKALARLTPKTLHFGWNDRTHEGVRIRIESDNHSGWHITPEHGIAKDVEAMAA